MNGITPDSADSAALLAASTRGPSSQVARSSDQERLKMAFRETVEARKKAARSWYEKHKGIVLVSTIPKRQGPMSPAARWSRFLANADID